MKIAFDWSQCLAVESVPGKLSGAWVFRGIRIPVSAVFENLEDGLDINEIVELFDGLEEEHVIAVLDFAAQSLLSQLRCVGYNRHKTFHTNKIFKDTGWRLSF